MEKFSIISALPCHRAIDGEWHSFEDIFEGFIVNWIEGSKELKDWGLSFLGREE